MLSIVSEREGDVVYIHADLAGLEVLERSLKRLRELVAQGECEHDHLFTESWGGHGLTETMLEKERSSGCKQVHHLQLYGWNDEWARKHGLLGRSGAH